MQLDVFTLFPQWFDWFRAPAPRRATRSRGGHELRRVNPRDHTPLSGGQVDDTPFGGGAGMVLRVDVMDAALRARYGVDPVDLRDAAARDRADARAGACSTTRFVDELAAEPALTLLCGRYEGFDERIVEHFATDAVSIGRYVLSGGELAAMVVLRRRAAQAAGRRSATRSRRVEESFSAALEGDARVPALHAPGRVARLARARGAALRPPRGDPPLAARAQPRARGVGPGRFATMSRPRARCPIRPRAVFSP